MWSVAGMLASRLTAAPGKRRPRPFELLDAFYLTSLCGEQEESPILFGDARESWLVALRRLEYPEGREILSLFQLESATWKEIRSVTPRPGRFEAICADATKNSQPAVVWTENQDAGWLIRAAHADQGQFGPPVTLSDPQRRCINPVVKANGVGGCAVVWEDYAEGGFSIWLARYDERKWSLPIQVTPPGRSCFEPALAWGVSGELYLTFSCADGPHRQILMAVVDPGQSKASAVVPVAVGGGFQDRVNINARSNVAVDRDGRVWITWENNRFASRPEDSDNYTGDRCCAMVCYQDGRLYHPAGQDRWLFQGKNDHLPTFHKDWEGNLYVVTHCGGGFVDNPFWSFRISYFDPLTGWTKPTTLFETEQKGESLRPTILFDRASDAFWLAWKREERKARSQCHPDAAQTLDGDRMVRRGMLVLQKFSAPRIDGIPGQLKLVETVVEEHHAVRDFKPRLSGRLRVPRVTVSHKGQTFTLLVGSLHEHSEHSNCWPAGTDGTLHDDYRYSLFSEGYDFQAITDHGYSMNEVYWRKTLRLADFYNDPIHFVVLPAVEWTLSNHGAFEITRGVGHRNVLFADTEEAQKFIRSSDEVYSCNSPETTDAEALWAFIHRTKINCVAVPHHPADRMHACCWEVHDPVIEPVVEIFQCRGNAEYRGAPRMLNVSRHDPTDNDKGFVDYALRDKAYRLGFVASGDHNNLGVGLACVWVTEVTREGVLDAIRHRRCFATTGDKMVVDFRLNGAFAGEEVERGEVPRMHFEVKAADEIASIDILRNSRVVHSVQPTAGALRESGEWVDSAPVADGGVRYYYIRVIQRNNHIAWSSPIWMSS